MQINRHDWVWLRPEWDGSPVSPDVETHHGLGLPFVAARKAPCDAPDTVNLGFVSALKQRVGFKVGFEQIQAVKPALMLERALDSAPHFWQPILDELNRTLAHLRIYGSLAWQCMTGQSHMTVGSDVDVLFYPKDSKGLDQGVAILSGYKTNGINLDGEIIFPDGAAVSWMEWAGGQNPVLSKSMISAGLWDRAVLMKAFST